jgi:hypothetical protein
MYDKAKMAFDGADASSWPYMCPLLSAADAAGMQQFLHVPPAVESDDESAGAADDVQHPWVGHPCALARALPIT